MYPTRERFSLRTFSNRVSWNGVWTQQRVSPQCWLPRLKTGARQRLMWLAATWATFKPSCCKWMLRSAFWWQHTWTGVKNNILRTICFTPNPFMLVSRIPLKARRTPPPPPHPPSVGQVHWSTSDAPPNPPPPSSPPPEPPGQSTHPGARVTDGRRGSAGVSWGLEGARLRSGRGAGVFGIVVTWPVCLSVCQSVCRWMRSMWPRNPHLLPKVRALIAGQEAWMRGFSGHPRPIPKNLRVSAYSAPPCTCSGNAQR